MGLWAFRKPVYKLGLFLQHAGFVLCVVGFCMPFWFYASPSAGAQGLWQYCNGHCSELEVAEDWFQMVRTLLCIGFIAYLAACVLALYDNFLINYDPLSYKPNRLPEIITAITGLVGAACLTVYTVKMKADYTDYPDNSFGVGYAITGGGCCVALLSSIVMLASGSTYTQKGILLTESGRRLPLTYLSTSHTHTRKSMCHNPSYRAHGAVREGPSPHNYSILASPAGLRSAPWPGSFESPSGHPTGTTTFGYGNGGLQTEQTRFSPSYAAAPPTTNKANDPYTPIYPSAPNFD